MSRGRAKGGAAAIAWIALLAIACLLPTQAAADSEGKTVTLQLADSHGLHLSFTSITARKGSFTAEQQGFTNQTTFDLRRNSDTLSYALYGKKVLQGRRINADLGPF